MTKPDSGTLENLETETLDFINIASSFDILDQESLEKGVVLTQRVKGMIDEIDETFTPHISAAHKAHKALLETKSKFTTPLDDVEKMLRTKLAIYLEDYPEAKAKGLSKREHVTVKVDDMMKLVRAVVKGTVPVECLKVDTSRLKKLAVAGFKIPGCESKSYPVISIRK